MVRQLTVFVKCWLKLFFKVWIWSGSVGEGVLTNWCQSEDTFFLSFFLFFLRVLVSPPKNASWSITRLAESWWVSQCPVLHLWKYWCTNIFVFVMLWMHLLDWGQLNGGDMAVCTSCVFALLCVCVCGQTMFGVLWSVSFGHHMVCRKVWLSLMWIKL